MIGIAEAYRQQIRQGLAINGGVDPVVHCALGLAGETGEIVDMVKKSQYLTPRPLTRDDVLNEGGDVLWYLVNFCDKFGVSIEDLMKANISKLEQRHIERGTFGGNCPYSLDRLLQRAGVMDNNSGTVVGSMLSPAGARMGYEAAGS